MAQKELQDYGRSSAIVVKGDMMERIIAVQNAFYFTQAQEVEVEAMSGRTWNRDVLRRRLSQRLSEFRAARRRS